MVMTMPCHLLPEEDVLDDPDDDDEADPTVPGDLWFVTDGPEVHRILGSSAPVR
jgi:hypothetical protein